MNKGSQKITPCLWFNMNCEEAINFYVDIFNSAPGSKKKSKIISIQKYPTNVDEEHMKGMEGKIINGVFKLDDQQFIGFDGGSVFKFNEAVSLTVDCADQEEVDYFWNKLTADGGEESQCGWLKDKFGLSWQIVPRQLGELISKDTSGRVMMAMLKMQKIVIKDLEAAANS